MPGSLRPVVVVVVVLMLLLQLVSPEQLLADPLAALWMEERAPWHQVLPTSRYVMMPCLVVRLVQRPFASMVSLGLIGR